MAGGKTLIMGAGGHVGQLLRGVWRDREDVVWQSRAGADFDWELADGPGSLARGMSDVSAVVCLAGATPGTGLDMAVNAAIAEAALAAAARAGVRTVILASSIAVYGPGRGPFGEADPCRPETDYGRAKLAMEAAGARASGQRLTVTSLRLGNVVGADALFRALAAGGAVTLDRFPDGATPARSYVDPEMLALVLDRLVVQSAKKALPAFLNVACAPPVAMGDLLAAVGIEPEYREAGAGTRRLVSLDPARLQAWVPEIAAPRSAEDMIAAWRQAKGTA